MHFELLTGDHQIPQRIEALDSKVVAPNYRELRQNGQNDASQLKVVVDEQLCVLHKRLNVLTNRVRVLRPSERLHKNALALRLLNLLNLVRVSVQLLEEPQSLVWMAVGCLQVVEKVL